MISIVSSLYLELNQAELTTVNVWKISSVLISEFVGFNGSNFQVSIFNT